MSFATEVKNEISSSMYELLEKTRSIDEAREIINEHLPYIDKELNTFLLNKNYNLGYDINFGARPLKRLISKTLEVELSRMLIEGKIKEHDIVVVNYVNEHLFENILGNVFTDSLEEIFEKLKNPLIEQINCEYKGLCANCDEYYTFNF